MTNTTELTKKRNLKYLNRDFEGFKRDFIEHLRIYFPDTIKDFNESSVGLAFTELAAFIGDNLSFYIDKKFDETFTETAKRRANIFKHGKQLGFKAFGKSSATGTVTGFLKVPAKSVNGKLEPDLDFAGIVKKGAKLKSKVGKTYETLDDIDFSKVDINDPNFTTVGDRDPTTSLPKTFVLKVEDIEIKAGETKTATFTVGGYEAFRKITLADDDVLEILSVKDSEGNDWFEVDFLAQDTIFISQTNTGADSADVPNVLKLKSVPFRFVSEYDVDTNRMSLIFGTGDAQNFDGELIPNLGDLSLPLFGKDAFTDFFLDPQNFLKTRTLGLSPTNTTLTVTYRFGGGADTDAGANEIDTVAEKTFDVGDTSLDQSTARDVGNSFSVLNEGAVQGGKDELSIDEIKQLIAAHHASQSRLVTPPDFIARSLSMPSKFGSVFRANARQSELNKNAVELIILSKNSAGHVSIAPGDLKTNLKRYLSRFRMTTDAIEILDGEIINIALDFSVLTDPDFTRSEILSNCLELLQEFFEIDKWQINQPINFTTIHQILASVPGVLSVISIDIINRAGNFEGRSYSTTPYSVRENIDNGILYCRENAIFEVKYPLRDLKGSAK